MRKQMNIVRAVAAAVPMLLAAQFASAAPVTLSAEGSGTLKFSNALVGALNAGGILVSEIDPATLVVEKRTNGQYKSVAASAPVTSLSGDLTGGTLTVSSVSTVGGARQFAPNDPEGFATTGGFLEIKNLRVDLTQKRVYATLIGDHGVGTVDDLYLWDIATITGPTSVQFGNGPVTATNSLTGLSINKPAFDLFATALGLTDPGVEALKTVKDFGRIDSTITAVPEPSAFALLGVGLVGMGLTARRRAR